MKSSNSSVRLFQVFVVLVFTAGAVSYELPKRLLMDFSNTRYQAYFHYNMATFKNCVSEEKVGRTYGDDPASMWTPAGLDTDQWAQVVKDGRMAGGWLTTKHHGGFCLWDSKFTDYDVASSEVSTDVVKAFTDSFRKAGLKIGLYYSILDYHHGITNGQVTAKEVDFLKNQITELLTNYGPIDYINFDGWSTYGSTATFDDVVYADLFKVVKAIQPNCLIVNHTYESNLAHADVPFADGTPFTKEYMRPCGVSSTIQNGWWWKHKGFRVDQSVEHIVKTLDRFNSVNAVYVLNISPDTNGRIPEDAAIRLKEVAKVWKKPADLTEVGDNWGYMYDVNENLAFMKPVSQSSTNKPVRDKRAAPRAEIALDGVTEGDLKLEQTSYTKNESKPWWKVDLEKTEEINQIIIYNRTDDQMDKLSDYWVYILAQDGKTVLWSSHQKRHPDPAITINTGGVEGQHVKIQLNGTGSLALAEVIVKGSCCKH